MNKYSTYASFNSDLALVSNNIIETMTNTELEMSGNLSVEGTLKASKFMTADGKVIDIDDAHKKIKEIKDTHVTTIKHNQLKDELLKADELLTKKSDFDNLKNEVSELKNSNVSNQEIKELRTKIESAKSTNLGPKQVIGTGNEKMVIGNMGHSSWAGIGHEKVNMDAGMSKLNYALLQHHDGVTNLNSSKGKPINFTQADVKKMVLSPEGNLGIGIDRPKHKLEVNGFIKSHGTDIILDNKARRGGKGGSARRALVHDFGDKLTINYEGDYKGGVKINGNIDANGGVGVKNDIHFTGGNNWTLHTPDDRRHILYLAPSTAYGNKSWNWGKQTRFHPNGNIDTKGNLSVSGNITGNKFLLNDGTEISSQIHKLKDVVLSSYDKNNVFGRIPNLEDVSKFNNLIRNLPLPFYLEFKGNSSTNKKVIYKRLSPVGNWNFFRLLHYDWFNSSKKIEGKAITNNMNTDFKLYSNIKDAIDDKNAWKFCNYNDPSVGFPRDCGVQKYVPSRWISYYPKPNGGRLSRRGKAGATWGNWSWTLINGESNLNGKTNLNGEININGDINLNGSIKGFKNNPSGTFYSSVSPKRINRGFRTVFKFVCGFELGWYDSQTNIEVDFSMKFSRQNSGKRNVIKGKSTCGYHHNRYIRSSGKVLITINSKNPSASCLHGGHPNQHLGYQVINRSMFGSRNAFGTMGWYLLRKGTYCYLIAACGDSRTDSGYFSAIFKTTIMDVTLKQVHVFSDDDSSYCVTKTLASDQKNNSPEKLKPKNYNVNNFWGEYKFVKNDYDNFIKINSTYTTEKSKESRHFNGPKDFEL